MPIAINCVDVLREIIGLGGEIAMNISVADVTVSVVVPDFPPDAAVMVVEPVPTDVASPLEPAALLIAATDVDDEVHVTVPVKSCVELSV